MTSLYRYVLLMVLDVIFHLDLARARCLPSLHISQSVLPVQSGTLVNIDCTITCPTKWPPLLLWTLHRNEIERTESKHISPVTVQLSVRPFSDQRDHVFHCHSEGLSRPVVISAQGTLLCEELACLSRHRKIREAITELNTGITSTTATPLSSEASTTVTEATTTHHIVTPIDKAAGETIATEKDNRTDITKSTIPFVTEPATTLPLVSISSPHTHTEHTTDSMTSVVPVANSDVTKSSLTTPLVTKTTSQKQTTTDVTTSTVDDVTDATTSTISRPPVTPTDSGVTAATKHPEETTTPVQATSTIPTLVPTPSASGIGIGVTAATKHPEETTTPVQATSTIPTSVPTPSSSGTPESNTNVDTIFNETEATMVPEITKVTKQARKTVIDLADPIYDTSDIVTALVNEQADDGSGDIAIQSMIAFLNNTIMSTMSTPSSVESSSSSSSTSSSSSASVTVSTPLQTTAETSVQTITHITPNVTESPTTQRITPKQTTIQITTTDIAKTTTTYHSTTASQTTGHVVATTEQPRTTSEMTTKPRTTKADINKCSTCIKSVKESEFGRIGGIAFAATVGVAGLLLLLVMILVVKLCCRPRRRSSEIPGADKHMPRLQMLEARDSTSAGYALEGGASVTESFDYEQHVQANIQKHKQKTKLPAGASSTPLAGVSSFLIGKRSNSRSNSTTPPTSPPSNSPTEGNPLIRAEDEDTFVFNFAKMPGQATGDRHGSVVDGADRRRSNASSGKPSSGKPRKGSHLPKDSYITDV